MIETTLPAGLERRLEDNRLIFEIKRSSLAMVLNNAVRQALTTGHLAHLVTLNADGSPQVSVVWVGFDGDEIVCAHLSPRKKLQNIQQDARVALSMVTFTFWLRTLQIFQFFRCIHIHK